jgi:hypothetical protein
MDHHYLCGKPLKTDSMSTVRCATPCQLKAQTYFLALLALILLCSSYSPAQAPNIDSQADLKAQREENCRPTDRTMCMDGFTTRMGVADALQNAEGLGFTSKKCERKPSFYEGLDKLYAQYYRDYECNLSRPDGMKLSLGWLNEKLFTIQEDAAQKGPLSRLYLIVVRENGLPTKIVDQGLTDETRMWDMVPGASPGIGIEFGHSCPNKCRYYASLVDGITFVEEGELAKAAVRARRLGAY